MSRRAAVFLTLLVAAAPLAAQERTDSAVILRDLLARVEQQRGVHETVERREAVRTAPLRRGRLQTEGSLAVLTLAITPRDVVARSAAEADSALKAFADIPDRFIRSIVLVALDDVSDSATLLVAPAVSGRTRLPMEWRHAWLQDESINPRYLVQPIANAYTATLDHTWQEWLPRNYGILWDAKEDGDQAISDLASVSGYARGKECLAGRLRSCRLFFGLDHDANEMMARFTPDEIVAETQYRTPPTADGNACRNHDVDACIRVMETLPREAVRRVPASAHERAGLLRALHDRHGGEAVRRAFADTTGSLGERLARAAGLTEDSLITEWRTWVLSRGRTERVSAGVGDFTSALIFILLLVAMATRSGRWR